MISSQVEAPPDSETTANKRNWDTIRFNLNRIESRHAEAGVAAVEFALVAPIFLILVFSIIIYGFYFATYIAVVHAASEGARGRSPG